MITSNHVKTTDNCTFLSFFGCQKSAQGGSRLYFLINSLLLQVNSVDQFSATVDLGDNFDGLLEA